MAHEVVLDLDLGRATPALTVEQPEHIAEHIHHEVDVLGAVVGVADTAAACHVVGIVSLRANPGVLEFARKVAVVE